MAELDDYCICCRVRLRDDSLSMWCASCRSAGECPHGAFVCKDHCRHVEQGNK